MKSTEVLRQWADRSGEYSPDYYAYYGPNETSELVRGRLDDAVDPDAAVLELGCSSGRHLAHLHEHGYENLHGVEINDEAFDVMADAYPGLDDDGTFYRDAIENVVADFEDGRFDAVFSVETLQHLHPDSEWVFDELSRITDERLVTVENESESASGSERKSESESGNGDGNKNGTEDDGEGGAGSESPVKYVNDDFPLYYRNWRRVFSERGFVEVDSEPVDRDTLRTFRPARD